MTSRDLASLAALAFTVGFIAALAVLFCIQVFVPVVGWLWLAAPPATGAAAVLLPVAYIFIGSRL